MDDVEEELAEEREPGVVTEDLPAIAGISLTVGAELASGWSGRQARASRCSCA